LPVPQIAKTNTEKGFVHCAETQGYITHWGKRIARVNTASSVFIRHGNSLFKVAIFSRCVFFTTELTLTLAHILAHILAYILALKMQHPYQNRFLVAWLSRSRQPAQVS
jgi:hypothetical protein